MDENVKILAATLSEAAHVDNIKDQTYTLHMTTEDNVEVYFELDLVSLSLLALTMDPLLRDAKRRVSEAKLG